MEEKKTVAFITLGCKVNIAETEGMKRLFQDKGYIIVDESEKADAYIINTCTVTSMGDKKSRQMLRRAYSLNPDGVIAAVGCFAQVFPNDASKIKGVNLVVGNNMKHQIVELVESAQKDKPQIYVKERESLLEYEDLPLENYDGHTRAFIKIQDGCEEFCSYCIIPYARGPIRSRDMDDIIIEAKKLADRGFKEIVLTGIHLTSYGTERDGPSLAYLIRALHEVDGIERIRLGSIEPLFITPEFIDEIKDLSKLCPHFHLSLQSGSANTLKHMNRKYTPDEFRNIVLSLREHISDVTITTDIMVGFPGETEEEFWESYRFCEEMGFLWMHVFKYSPRKGTPAAHFKDQVDKRGKDFRSKTMIKLAENMREKTFKHFVGYQASVILEHTINGNEDDMVGLTPNYIPVFVRIKNEKAGEILKVVLAEAEADRMQGLIL